MSGKSLTLKSQLSSPALKMSLHQRQKSAFFGHFSYFLIPVSNEIGKYLGVNLDIVSNQKEIFDTSHLGVPKEVARLDGLFFE